ncbi:hypothetical protein DFH28DRAFT_893584, partial [Melampsora americana]
LGDDEDATNEDITIGNITALGKPNTRIDHMIPVFCLPENKYVLLTNSDINRWAKAIHNKRIHGVSLTSPLTKLIGTIRPEACARAPPRQRHGYVDTPPVYDYGNQSGSNYEASVVLRLKLMEMLLS